MRCHCLFHLQNYLFDRYMEKDSKLILWQIKYVRLIHIVYFKFRIGLSLTHHILSKLTANLLPCYQHMENAYPGSNILVVTLTNEESKRVEAQSDKETLKEAMGALRDMFGLNIPEATDIFVPRWWNNRFQRGSYSNYPVISNGQVVRDIKVCLLSLIFYFTINRSNFTSHIC